MNRNVMIRYLLYLLLMIFIFYLMSFNSSNNNRCYLKKRSRKLLFDKNIEYLSSEQKTLKMLIKRSIILESRINELEHNIK